MFQGAVGQPGSLRALGARDPGSNPGSPILEALKTFQDFKQYKKINKMARTKKVKSTGRYGAGYGKRARLKLINVESKQRKKQTCPFCKRASIKRKSAGIWECKRCSKIFASNAYYIK